MLRQALSVVVFGVPVAIFACSVAVILWQAFSAVFLVTGWSHKKTVGAGLLLYLAAAFSLFALSGCYTGYSHTSDAKIWQSDRARPVPRVYWQCRDAGGKQECGLFDQHGQRRYDMERAVPL